MTPDVGPPRRERPELKPTPQLRPMRLLASALTVALLIGAGWAGWKYVGTNIVAKQRQGEMAVALADDWKGNRQGDAATDKLRIGQVFAVLRVPRFGDDFEVPVVAGVDDTALTSGVGWFPDTQRPGQIGNFAVAGHRVTNGQPFKDFPDLRAGDLVEVETRTHVYTYELQNSGTDTIVDFTDIWVVQPVPEKARKAKDQRSGAKPSEALLTLTTCSEIFHTDNRSAVFGTLVDAKHV
ncbi:class E sortase [Aeromicrobium duanguangcaii]|uniref:Class E sortase n=1 Tax=Aeromicrobium duanguangcaii TaxID=2968086 RepID=A0ABY5KEQ0_9ACTN|nr:class E sortase [Aeromicrobium duanguangcaii]MCD9155425.1 class E sortase [Aeromicrobium duanguangcaii]UUI68304.1 class E sortase [Aeromicrobium duanguangcaii]